MKICPIMSRVVVMDFGADDRGVEPRFVECQEGKCQFWIEAYTTEGYRWNNCAIALNPIMVNGEIHV